MKKYIKGKIVKLVDLDMNLAKIDRIKNGIKKQFMYHILSHFIYYNNQQF